MLYAWYVQGFSVGDPKVRDYVWQVCVGLKMGVDVFPGRSPVGVPDVGISLGYLVETIVYEMVINFKD